MGVTSKAYKAFLDACHAAGTKCALSYTTDKSGSDIAARIDATLEKLYDSGGAVINQKAVRGVLTSGNIRCKPKSNQVVPD
jgi:hypothetical protein